MDILVDLVLFCGGVLVGFIVSAFTRADDKTKTVTKKLAGEAVDEIRSKIESK